jgi:hypothetical protein
MVVMPLLHRWDIITIWNCRRMMMNEDVFLKQRGAAQPARLQHNIAGKSKWLPVPVSP